MILTWNLDQLLNLSRKTKQRQKRLDDNDMSKFFDVIVIFLIRGQFGAIQKPDSGCIVCHSCIFINSILLYYKNRKQK